MFFNVQKTCHYFAHADNVMLECSKRAENIINRKVSIFYIETVLNFFSAPKNIFSEIDRKNGKK